ncbi:GNAT family N-acetyltransferase [Bowmanella dokdonensis]|uniref:GNAT family N-acetyltransferase n=1 Tax=Bowmanella dokdonensis TaxID=751969 RepID=A0A939DR91_9ALTE|nr:GNAT family N-acetyltransferase [Bowmanella dokdonensis]MBN7827347.1 GNAT family N-acetyltransferase [Bowmanella dokdonensis]
MEFRTQRLFCRPLRESDKQIYCFLYTDTEVMRKISNPISIQSAEKNFQKALMNNANKPFAQLSWAIEEIQTSRIIGIKGFRWHHSGASETEIGMMLVPEAQGMRYAVEGLGALVDYGFKYLSLRRIFAQYNVGHLASENLVKRLGFTVLPDIIDTLYGSTKRCEIHAQNWQACEITRAIVS